MQEFRRKFMFQYCEAITAAIRHPRTIGRLAGLRSAAFMRWQLKDPELRRKVWPDYTFGCKRVLFSSHYLPALQRRNVDVVADPIARVVARGHRHGRRHAARARLHHLGAPASRRTTSCSRCRSSARRRADLRDAWADGAHAHLGMTVPGFPNMFVMYGPNTNTSGGSIIVYLEAQAAYLRQALQQLRARGARAVEVRAEVEQASDRALQARFAGTAWTRCDSWYRDERGRIVANWPGYMREYLRADAHARPERVTASRRRRAAAAPAQLADAPTS